MAATATKLAQYQMYIGGKWTDALSGATFASDNPFTTQAVSFLSPFGDYKRSGLGRENG